MTKISIQGMLVDASYDDPFLHREISNGVFCPSSLVLRQMDEANGDDLEIHINSEGGDVFAFNEVANRIASYPASVKLIIGSCAFSEAANLALTCGRPIFIHQNSVMLWHSAMSTVYDGAVGELKAEAEILEKINAPIKKALKAHGIPEEEVERGFQDRNALVLGADDLVKYGIATLLEEEAPEQPKIDEAISMRLAALAEANQRIAAHFHSIKSVNKSEMKSEEITKELEEALGIKSLTDEEKKETPCAEETEEKKEEEAPVEETKEETPSEETKEEETPSEGTEEEKKEEEAPTSEETEEEDPLLKTLETLKENMESLTGRMNALEEKLTEKEVELQDAKKALKAERSKRIGAMAAAVSGKTESSGPADWPAAVKACKGDKLEAYKKYPELARAWTKSN